MRQIDFENGKTTVSKETFEAFQANITEAIDGTTIFENWDGISGDVPLEEDYTQYSKLRIYAGKGEAGITAIEIPKELYSKKINIVQAQRVGTVLQLITKQFYLDGMYLKVYGSPGYINFNNKEITEQGDENLILVYKVVGFE